MIEALTTTRLILEPLTEEHGDALFAGLDDDRIYEFIEEQRPRDAEQLRQRYRRLSTLRSPDRSQYWLNWAVLLPEANQYVGYVQATVSMNGAASIGYVLFPSMWGCGYATEAVEAMMNFLRTRYSTRAFSATVDVRNERSVRVLERLGYVRAPMRDKETVSAVDETNEAVYLKSD